MTRLNAFFDKSAQLLYRYADGSDQAVLDKFDELSVHHVTWNLRVAEHPPVFSIPALTVAAVAFLAALTGCASQHDQDSTIRLGWTPGATAPQVAIAADRGLWNNAGLHVDTTTFNSGREALEALLGGTLDAAVLTDFPLATAALSNAPITAIDTLSTYRHYRIIGDRGKGVTDMTSLNGKKIATTTGTNMHFITSEALHTAGVSAEVVNVGPSDIVAAVSRGDVDAGVMFDSYYPAAQKSLADRYTEIPVDPALYTGHMLLVVSNTAIHGKPDKVQKLVNGAVDAAKLTASASADSQSTLLTAMGQSISAEQLAKMWADYDYTPHLGDDLTTLLVREAQWIQKQQNVGRGTVVNSAFFAPHIDPTFLNNAL